ncbi:MAG TPA: YHS domain protein, partial [Chitinophagaceae bacterium]
MERFFLIIALFTISTNVSFSQEALATRKKHLNLDKKGLAIEGYDPVAYFKNNKAIEGKKEFAVNFENAIYYFANA